MVRKKHIIRSVNDIRNIVVSAVDKSKTKEHIKIFYTFGNGSQIDVYYTNEVYFKYFSIVLNELLESIEPTALIKNVRFKECAFFCCSNCLAVGKEKQNKLIRNYCNKCAKKYEKKHMADVLKRDKIREELEAQRLKRASQIKEIEEVVFSPFIKEKEIKKRVSPFKK